VKALRKSRGLTLQSIASKRRVSLTVLQDLERGKTQGTVHTLGVIAAALGVSADSLLKRNPHWRARS
jgi:transcriptional regulator with XRE-family HTH domain